MSNAVTTIADEQISRIKAEYKQKQREKNKLKQKKQKEEREARAKAKKIQLEMEAEKMKKTKEVSEKRQESATKNSEEDEILRKKFEKQRIQQGRDAAEKIASIAAREALNGASLLMKKNLTNQNNNNSGEDQSLKKKNVIASEIQRNGHKNVAKHEKMNGLNKAELSQVKMKKMDPNQMLSSCELEASFTNNGWGELSSTEPWYPPNTSSKAGPPPSPLTSSNPTKGLKNSNLPPGLNISSTDDSLLNGLFGVKQPVPSRSSLAVSYESDSRIISMSPLMKPLKSPLNDYHQDNTQNKGEKGDDGLMPSSLSSFFDLHGDPKTDNVSSGGGGGGNDINEGKVLHVSRYPKATTTKDIIYENFSKYAEVTYDYYCFF